MDRQGGKNERKGEEEIRGRGTLWFRKLLLRLDELGRVLGVLDGLGGRLGRCLVLDVLRGTPLWFRNLLLRLDELGRVLGVLDGLGGGLGRCLVLDVLRSTPCMSTNEHRTVCGGGLTEPTNEEKRMQQATCSGN